MDKKLVEILEKQTDAMQSLEDTAMQYVEHIAGLNNHIDDLLNIIGIFASNMEIKNDDWKIKMNHSVITAILNGHTKKGDTIQEVLKKAAKSIKK